MTWNNLHFRPPIMRDRIIGGGRASDLLLIRNVRKGKGASETTFAGYIMIKPMLPNEYRICGRGCTEHSVIPSQIEWMEVPG